MGLLDRLMGRSKMAAGDMMNDPDLRREGAHQDAEGGAEDRARTHEESAMAERQAAAEHRAERETT